MVRRKEDILKVKDLIKELEKLPQDRSVLCQVVGTEDGAWNMQFEFKNVEHSDWTVQLKVSHPGLKKLPMDDDLFVAA